MTSPFFDARSISFHRCGTAVLQQTACVYVFGQYKANVVFCCGSSVVSEAVFATVCRDAFSHVQERRFCINPNVGFVHQLQVRCGFRKEVLRVTKRLNCDNSISVCGPVLLKQHCVNAFYTLSTSWTLKSDAFSRNWKCSGVLSGGNRHQHVYSSGKMFFQELAIAFTRDLTVSYVAAFNHRAGCFRLWEDEKKKSPGVIFAFVCVPSCSPGGKCLEKKRL